MDSDTDDKAEGFTLTLETPESETAITIKDKQKLETVRQLLDHYGNEVFGEVGQTSRYNPAEHQYTEKEFYNLTRTQQSETIITILLRIQPCTINKICQEIFQADETARTTIHYLLTEYWKNIIEEYNQGDESHYRTYYNIELDRESHPLHKIASIQKQEKTYRCNDCDSGFETHREAKKHRKQAGHLNWSMANASDIMENWNTD